MAAGILLLICCIVVLVVVVCLARRRRKRNKNNNVDNVDNNVVVVVVGKEMQIDVAAAAVAPLNNNQYGILPQQSPYERGNMETATVVAPRMVGTNYSNPAILRDDPAVVVGTTHYSNANVLN